MKALIKEKREVAKGTLKVVFDLLGHEVDFGPGQYFWVELLNPPYDDEKGSAPHLGRDLAERARRARPRTRLRDRAFKRSLAELPVEPRSTSRSRRAVRAPGGDRPAVRVHRRRHRHHRVSQHAPLHRRGEAPAPRDAGLLEPRPGVDRVPGRAPGTRAGHPRAEGRPGDDGGPGLGRRDAADRRRFVRDHLADDLGTSRTSSRDRPEWSRASPTSSRARACPRSRSSAPASRGTKQTRSGTFAVGPRPRLAAWRRRRPSSTPARSAATRPASGSAAARRAAAGARSSRSAPRLARRTRAAARPGRSCGSSRSRPTDAERGSTGVSELDRVLGGGLVPASLVLVGGEPGHRQVDAAAHGARAR